METIKSPAFIAVEIFVDISGRCGITLGVPVGRGYHEFDGTSRFISIELDEDVTKGDSINLYAFEDARKLCDHESVNRQRYQEYFGEET